MSAELCSDGIQGASLWQHVIMHRRMCAAHVCIYHAYATSLAVVCVRVLWQGWCRASVRDRTAVMSSLMTHPELFRDMLLLLHVSHTLQRAARKASTEAELCSAASGASRAFVAEQSTVSAVDQAKAILIAASRAVVVMHTCVAVRLC